MKAPNTTFLILTVTDGTNRLISKFYCLSWPIHLSNDLNAKVHVTVFGTLKAPPETWQSWVRWSQSRPLSPSLWLCPASCLCIPQLVCPGSIHPNPSKKEKNSSGQRVANASRLACLWEHRTKEQVHVIWAENSGIPNTWNAQKVKDWKGTPDGHNPLGSWQERQLRKARMGTL